MKRGRFPGSGLVAEQTCNKLKQDFPLGPRELAVFRSSAVGAIYGPASKCSRSSSYDNPSTDYKKNSIVGTRDPVAHRRRKKAWDRSMGFRGEHPNHRPSSCSHSHQFSAWY